MVEDESSGDENALESPDKSISLAPNGDFSLEAYSQKQIIDKQKVSIFSKPRPKLLIWRRRTITSQAKSTTWKTRWRSGKSC